MKLFARRLTEPFILIALGLVAAGTWAFVGIASEVLEGEAQAVDRWLHNLLSDPSAASRAIGPDWLRVASRDITALGDVAVLVLVVLAVTVFLILARRVRTALFVLAATASGVVLAAALKHLFGQERPAVAPQDLYFTTSSFPSGHAMMAAVVYLTLGALLARLVPTWPLKTYVMGVALAVTLLVGVSRIYLGIHWLSDVAAGWAVGAAWALAWWVLAQLFAGPDSPRSGAGGPR